MSWLRDFFTALPDAGRALWEFGEGFQGVGIFLGSAALAVVFILAAVRLRPRQGWLSSIFAVMGGTVVAWWAFGIVPSAWVYFMDGERELLEGRVIPAALPGMDNFYEVFRDVVVAAETGVAIVAFGVLATYIQKRFPRALAEGEEAQPKTGGYK